MQEQILHFLKMLSDRFTRRRVLFVALRAPVTEKGVEDFSGNVAALRNGGTSTVLLNMGQWTLLPGESLHIGSQTDVNMVEFSGIAVTFDTSTGTINLLQILEIGEKFC